MSLIRRRLFLLDTFGLIFRAFYGRAHAAVSGLRTSAGLPTEAIYVFNNMLKRFLEEHEPDFVVAVWEGHGPTFRERIYPEYKANRDQMPEDLAAQLPYIQRLLEAWNITVCSEDGYEADDTIGLLTGQASDLDVEVWIVSSDKDLMQLVGADVVMLNPAKNERYGEREVEAFMGVQPSRVTDMLALKGDSVDNIPGAPGIGPKGAKQLIEAYGDIESIIEHAGEVKRKSYRESLQNNADQIRLSKRLASLDTGGTLRLDLDTAQHVEPDRDQLLELYRELEFRSLAGQLERTNGQSGTTTKVTVLASAEQLDAWLAKASEPVSIAILEPASNESKDSNAPGVGLSADAEGAWRIPAELMPQAIDLLKACGKRICVHDWKSAIHAFRRLGLEFPAAADDTMLMAFLADSSRTVYTLPKTVERRLGTAWRPDAGVAAAQTHLLRKQLAQEIDSTDLRELYDTVERPLAPVLARMETAGVLLERAVLTDLSSRLAEKIGELGREIHELAGRKFNIGSPKQLGEVLYEDLQLPKPAKRGKTKTPSTASDVLEGLSSRHPIPSMVLDWRQFTKLKNTYVDVLPDLVADDGRLHTTFNPTGSATGRLSSLNPNLQNIPARTELGREIRKAFVARPGWCLIAADYSQIELRVLAHMSSDPRLLDAFRSGEDIHTTTASEVLGIDPRLVSPDERHRAKAVNFGIIYGLSAFGLAKQLKIPQKSARDYIARYFDRYGAVKEFLQEIVERARKSGYSETLFGRRRPVRNLDSRSAPARAVAARIAQNSPIQGTAADLIKKAMVSTDAALASGGFRAQMLLQVHDELLIEAPRSESEEVSALVRREMESAASLEVPLVVDLKSGPNWRDMQPGR